MPPAAARAVLASLALTGAALAVDTEGLRLNQLQVIGTHNSYKQAIEPRLLAWMLTFSDDAKGLDYAHRPLDEQLDLGVRALEIDVFNDPQGGRYAAPRAQQLLRLAGHTPAPSDPDGAMLRPGFKVMHSADFDFRSNHPTLADALAVLRAWSEAHPDHLPVVVTVNLKVGADPIPDATQAAAFDAAAMDALDAAVRAGLGERLVTPDLVRGDAPTLRDAVLSRGWPQVDALRGRFLWVLDEKGDHRDRYVDGHPSLAERVFFTTSEPDEPEAAFLIINDPVADLDRIRHHVREGFLVRTRADAATAEARRGDRSRFRAATACGAHVVSTDYPYDEDRFGNGYRVVFEEETYARRNPVTGAEPVAARPPVTRPAP